MPIPLAPISPNVNYYGPPKSIKDTGGKIPQAKWGTPEYEKEMADRKKWRDRQNPPRKDKDKREPGKRDTNFYENVKVQRLF